MRTVIVADQEQEWFDIPDAPVLAARRYLTEHESERDAGVRVLNLCRTGRYQGRGYYVSLLAEARGHRPMPGVKAVEEVKSEAFVQALAQELQPLVQETLHHDDSERFQVDAYLGKDPAQRHHALAEQLFASVRMPLLRAVFARGGGHWCLEGVQAIGIADIPAQDRAFLLSREQSRRAARTRARPAARWRCWRISSRGGRRRTGLSELPSTRRCGRRRRCGPAPAVPGRSSRRSAPA